MMGATKAQNCLYPMWQDGPGGQAATGWTTLDQGVNPLGVYEALMSAARALSDAKQLFVTIALKADGGGSTGTGPYSTVMDRAQFWVENENQGKLLAVPAPKESIFVPGTDVVDMSNPDVVAFTTQVKAVLGDSFGNPWIRISQGKRRKVTIGRG